MFASRLLSLPQTVTQLFASCENFFRMDAAFTGVLGTSVPPNVRCRNWLALGFALVSLSLSAAEPKPAPLPGDKVIADYFRAETHKLAKRCLTEIETAADWDKNKNEMRRQLAEMLGLDPMPERTPLNPVVTGKVDHPEFTVEKLHFQSRPGLYVTGNLYVPKNLKGTVPAILYVCGHGKVVEDGVSLGNKTHYQHHGGWFARNGYVCLVIDTIQLGEIEGVHHGTYNLKQWEWNARGYSPAGVEAWNGIRALDYLETRPEVDKTKFGVTGRSGGGAYSWWVAALDERIQCAVPTAGITDLENHVVDGTVEGHCDCMFQVNTYRWDFGKVAALVAPRPLLISNTDKDGIFPLEGVVRVHERTRRVYKTLGAADKLGLQITEGGHNDTQELHIHAFRWFNRWLKGDEKSQVTITAEPLFPKMELRVFDKLPQDEIVTSIQKQFVKLALPPEVPSNESAWKEQEAKWLKGLKEKSFAGWPTEEETPPLDVKVTELTKSPNVRARIDFTSQDGVRLSMLVNDLSKTARADMKSVHVEVVDEARWNSIRDWFSADGKPKGGSEPDLNVPFSANAPGTYVYLLPRGVGPTAWDPTEKKQTQHRRRFQLLGQTLDGMRVWDIRRALQALRATTKVDQGNVAIRAKGNDAGLALYAALFEPGVSALYLKDLPTSHERGPDFLNVLRILDTPATVAMVAGKGTKVHIDQEGTTGWEYPQQVAKKLGWVDRITVGAPPGK